PRGIERFQRTRMPCTRYQFEQRIDLRGFAHPECQRDPALLRRRCPSGVHTRDDLLVVEGQPVSARQFDFDMRAVGFGNVQPKQPVEAERPRHVRGSDLDDGRYHSNVHTCTLGRRLRRVMNKSDTRDARAGANVSVSRPVIAAVMPRQLRYYYPWRMTRLLSS